MKMMKPARTHHQFNVFAHGTRSIAAAMLFRTASQMTHCNPVSVANGTDNATWAIWVNTGVGRTSRRTTSGGGASSSR